jgi:hypothetical protein
MYPCTRIIRNNHFYDDTEIVHHTSEAHLIEVNIAYLDELHAIVCDVCSTSGKMGIVNEYIPNERGTGVVNRVSHGQSHDDLRGIHISFR